MEVLVSLLYKEFYSGLKIIISSIADFLFFLFHKQKIEFATLDGYRSMLSEALVSSSLNIGLVKAISVLNADFLRDQVYLGLFLWSLDTFRAFL